MLPTNIFLTWDNSFPRCCETESSVYNFVQAIVFLNYHTITGCSNTSHFFLYDCAEDLLRGAFSCYNAQVLSWYTLWPQMVSNNYTQKWWGTKHICPTQPKRNVSSVRLCLARSPKCHNYFSATQQVQGKVWSQLILL